MKDKDLRILHNKENFVDTEEVIAILADQIDSLNEVSYQDADDADREARLEVAGTIAVLVDELLTAIKYSEEWGR